MANIKFFYNNVLTTAAATLKNGTGGGAPALDQDPDFLMSNLSIPDRYSVWKTSASPTDPLQVDFEMLQTLTGVGIANYDADWPLGDVEVYYSTSAYPPGGWTLLTSFTPSATRKNMVTAVSVANVRSLRFEMASHSLSSAVLGKFLAFTGVLDIGKQSAPGSSEEYIQQTTREETYGGLPILTRTGPDKRRFRLLWPTASATIKTGMDTLLGLGTSFFLMTHEPIPYEVCFANGRLVKPRIWDPPALYDLDVLLDELP